MRENKMAASIGDYTTVTHLGASVTQFEALFCPFREVPYPTRWPTSPASKDKIAKRQPAKMGSTSPSFFFLCSARLVLALTPQVISMKLLRKVRKSSAWDTAPAISILAKNNVLPAMFLGTLKYRFPIGGYVVNFVHAKE